jgi:hypothetical protein
MKKKEYLRLRLILAIFFIALGGWLLHLMIHPPAKNLVNYIPAVAGFISVIVIPLLFIFRSTTTLAFLLNGVTVIIGTITMAHYSIKHPPQAWTLQTILLGTLLADILLLWGKFAMGKALFEMEITVNHPDDPVRGGNFFRFPNMGFWLALFVALTAIYIIGNYIGYRLWK